MLRHLRTAVSRAGAVAGLTTLLLVGSMGATAHAALLLQGAVGSTAHVIPNVSPCQVLTNRDKDTIVAGTDPVSGNATR